MSLISKKVTPLGGKILCALNVAIMNRLVRAGYTPIVTTSPADGKAPTPVEKVVASSQPMLVVGNSSAY